MKWQVTLKNKDVYIVDDDQAWLWVLLERNLDLTYTQAHVKIADGSLEVITMLLYLASVINGKTELKLHESWVNHEFDNFDIAGDVDPKDTQAEASSET